MWVDELKKMKAKTGMTTAQISAGAGIPEPTLEKLFAGTTKDPKLPTMQKLVKYLGGTLDDLYPDDEKENTPMSSNAPGAILDAEKAYSAFVDAGLLKAGQDLDVDDLAFLMAIGNAVRLWFENRHDSVKG